MNTQEKIEKRREESKKAQALNKKRENAKISYKVKNRIVGVLVTLLCICALFALIFPNTGWSRRVTTAVKIGDEKISSAEYSYYYKTAYSNYYQMLQQYFGSSYMPIDTTKSLKKQQMSDDMTYAEYFSQNAIANLTQLVTLSKEAEKAGFELPEAYQTQFDGVISNVEAYAQMYGLSVSQYLNRYVSMGFNMNLYKKCVYRELLAQAYAEYKEGEPTYTEDDMNAYYQEHKTDYDTADVHIVQFSAAGATETTEEVTVEMAKQNADDFISGVKTEEAFVEAAIAKANAEAAEGTEVTEDTSEVKNLTYANAVSLDTNVASWIFDEAREAGEVSVVESATGESFYAIYVTRPAERSEQNVVNVRHILVLVQDFSDEEAVAAGKQKAEEILQEYNDLGGGEDLFASLAEQYSEDTGSNTNGGLYENVYPGQMVEPFENWCFDPIRKEGSTGIVETSYGYHVMYFVSQGAPYWQIQVENNMRAADYDAWYTSVSENYSASTNWLGVLLRTEPI